jgi:hypothetical protein
MKKSLKYRLKLTKNKKILHRTTTLGHSRANKSNLQKRRKKGYRQIKIKLKKIKK